MKAEQSELAGVVVTGIGMVTPLGTSAQEVLCRMESGETAAREPTGFDASPFACPVCAEVPDFEPGSYVGPSKAFRLMGRDALFAVAAARLAMNDAGVKAGREYPPEDIALYGATGLAGLPFAEVAPLINCSTGPDGAFDPQRFGEVALKRVRPVLSFKILSNMPVCFVSMFEGTRGPNAVYNPWEGQGAQAISAGIRAIRHGDARCALVGGCDVKTHELAFISLEQQGVFRSWHDEGVGPVPGEGAAFLVLEHEDSALARGAHLHARIAAFGSRIAESGTVGSDLYASLQSTLTTAPPQAAVSAADGDRRLELAEEKALGRAGVTGPSLLKPKAHLGNLFAAAAAIQLGLGATLAGKEERVLVNCFGHGRVKAAFLLERP